MACAAVFGGGAGGFSNSVNFVSLFAPAIEGLDFFRRQVGGGQCPGPRDEGVGVV